MSHGIMPLRRLEEGNRLIVGYEVLSGSIFKNETFYLTEHVVKHLHLQQNCVDVKNQFG